MDTRPFSPIFQMGLGTRLWIEASSPSMPKKLQVADCTRKPKYMFSFSVANYSKTVQKALNKGCSTWNQTISLGITSSYCWVHMWVCPTPPVNVPSTVKPSNISKHSQLHFLFSWAVYKQLAFYKICSTSPSWTYLSPVVPQYFNFLLLQCVYATLWFSISNFVTITHLPMFYIRVHYQDHTSNQIVIWKSVNHISLKKKGHYTKSLKVNTGASLAVLGWLGDGEMLFYVRKTVRRQALSHMVGESISTHAYLEDTCSVIRKWMLLSGQITRNTACHQKVWGQSNHHKHTTLVYNKS